MKNTKKLFCTLTAVVLLLSMVCTGLGEGRLVKIWNAAVSLLTDTENVSLTGHATFTYDGEVFKIFDGRYKQDGYKSYMQVMLDTPKADGTTYTGGYTVIGEGGSAYSMETVTPRIYHEQSAAYENTILTNHALRALLPFGTMIAELAEERFVPFVTEKAVGEGVQYHLKANGNDLPGAFSDALSMVMELCGREYLYLDSGLDFTMEATTGAYYEDYEGLLNHMYEKSFGEPMPENIYELLYDEKGNSTDMMRRYDLVSDLCTLLYNETEDAYYGKCVAVIMADGSVQLFDTNDDYLIAMGREYVNFEDDVEKPFRTWYEKTTGQPLSHEEFIALQQSNNEELNEVYFDKLTAMEEEYLIKLREDGYSCGLVRKDGTLVGMKSTAELSRLSYLTNCTVTERIFRTTEEMKIDGVDAAVELDKDGRIASVAGKIEFVLTDVFGEKHSLSVDFSGMASDYGATVLKAFDPQEYGVVSASEYYSGDYSINDADDWQSAPEIELPEKITFFGKEYTVKVSND
ncbi:MAG: hypothetical protein IKW00_05525 [Clostridia bacterium]|nr:hypothetical protein [Clostridia bacterium]